jgi:ABC-type Mn2+/Zn2+ transport system ATPase subunit
MAEHAACAFGELSGGQRQRVFLARALTHGGRVMLLDEPLSAVDAASATIIMNTIRRLRDAGRTLLIATHDLNEAAATCDRLMFLNRRLVAYGTPAETFTTDTLTRTYEGTTLMVLDPVDGRPIGVLDDGAHHEHDGHDPSHGHDHPPHHEHPSRR